MRYFLLTLTLLLPLGLFADTLQIGSTLPNLIIKDQFEKSVSITPQTKQIIVVFTKEQGEVVKAHLEKFPNYLNEIKALYFMDTTAVPGMVMSLFMIPKFKKYPYTIGLLEEDKDVAYFPKEDKKITFISLENLTVTDIAFKEGL